MAEVAKFTLKDFLTEDAPYGTFLITQEDSINKRIKKHKMQYKRVLNPEKWREYLNYAAT